MAEERFHIGNAAGFATDRVDAGAPVVQALIDAGAPAALQEGGERFLVFGATGLHTHGQGQVVGTEEADVDALDAGDGLAVSDPLQVLDLGNA